MRKSKLFIVGAVALGLVLLYSAVALYQKSAVQSDIQGVSNSLVEYEAKMLQFENKRVLEASRAKQALNQLNGDMTLWSNIIKKIQNTIPKSFGIPIVDVLSYSGTGGEDISLNVKTNAGSATPYYDAANLIKAFDDSGYFTDTFVPSISSGIDAGGKEVLTFLISTKYLRDDLVAATPVADEPKADSEAKAKAVMNEIINEEGLAR